MLRIFLTVLLVAVPAALRAAPFDNMDKNGDGRLSRREFLGPRPAFRRLDRDRDDYISRDEARGTRMLPGRRGEEERQRPSAPRYTVPFIDTHNHLMAEGRGGGEADYPGTFRRALRTMDELNITKNILLPPPQYRGQPNAYDAGELLALAQENPERLAVMAGGGTLNMTILAAAKKRTVSAKAKQSFRAQAEGWLKRGAVGFGEMGAEHFSFNEHHPYLSVPPDHPLYLLLADVAAEHGVPIDFHMEAIPRDMKLPKLLKSPPNPPQLKANIPAFERLLAHNRKAKIVWAHLGWDNTGARSPEDTRRMLKKHPNLYMSVRLPTELHLRQTPEPSRIFDSGGKIKPAWLEVFTAFPDRFVMGSDEFFMSPQGRRSRHGSTGSAEGSAKFLSQLPKAVAEKIGRTNAQRIYPLGD